MTTFTLSIEPASGKAYTHPFHFGTIEATARQLAVEKFNSLSRHVKPPSSRAAMRGMVGRLTTSTP